MDTNILSIPILILLPLIAAGIIASPLLYNNSIFTRRFAKGFSILHFFYASMFFLLNTTNKSLLTFGTSNSHEPYLTSRIPLLDNAILHQIGIHVTFSLDNLSILMVILTTLVFTITIVAAKLFIKEHIKMFYSLIFILESILLMIFTTNDMFVFFTLWELELIPMYFLISMWGNKNAKASATKFVLYTFGGSLFLLLGILLIYYTNFATSGVFSADINQISFLTKNPLIQIIISVLLLIGFGVKIPIVPMHRWLADAHTDAITPVSMILAAILLKLGVYGLIRFNMQILPLGFTILAPIIGILAIVNIIYGAMLAYNQKNIKKVVAYSSISQMGIILLGIATLNQIAYIGSVFHMISHALVVMGLFMIVGIVKQRFKTHNMKRLSGIASVMPRLYGFSVLISLAAIGIPFLSGFIGEFLNIYGAFNSVMSIFKLFALITVAVLVLSALYILNLIHEIFMGSIPEKYKHVQDIAVHEFLVLSAISLLIVILGCCPFVIINFLSP